MHDAPARVLEVAAHGRAPLRVAITDQHPVVGERLVVGKNSRRRSPSVRQASESGGAGTRRSPNLHK